MLAAFKRMFSRMEREGAHVGEALEFRGIACIMVSDVATFGTVVAQITPDRAVSLMSDCLDHQLRVIAKHGGSVDQYAGCTVVSYWPPAEPSLLASQAMAAAREMVASLPKLQGIKCTMKVGFSVAECARAVFGPSQNFRIQIIGRARSRAELALNSPSLQAGIAIDPETFALLAASDQVQFQRDGSENYFLAPN